MPYDVQAWASRCRTGNGTLKAVLTTLAQFSDEHGLCWPSQERLAWETEYTDRTIRDALAKLEEKGFIRRQPRFNPDGTRKVDFIYLQIENDALPMEKPPIHRKELPVASTGKLRTDPPREPPEGASGEPPVRTTRKKEEANASSKDRRHRLPKDFSLTQSRVDMAAGFGLDILETKEEFDEFVDYWTGRGHPMLDWDATLRNHFRKAARRRAERKARQAPLGSRGGRPGSFIDAGLRYAARAASLVSEPGGDGGEDRLPF